jgi:hypothetical protein
MDSAGIEFYWWKNRETILVAVLNVICFNCFGTQAKGRKRK